MSDYQDPNSFSYLPDSDLEALEPQPSKIKEFFRELFETLFLAVVLFLVINTLTARVRVDGPSMEPTYTNGNRVIVSKIAYKIGDIQRGDVIVFPAPPNPNEDYIKRVIGLPGDEILIMNGEVFVNNIKLDEPYISAPPINNMRSTTVPEGNVFVMGDNRNVSSDSRSWGPLPIDDIIGKAVFVYWPLEKIGLVNHYDLLSSGG